MAKQKMGHVEVPYPTPEQGLHSLQHVGSAALGRETIPQNELIQHAWVSLGGTLTMVFPPAGPMTANKPVQLSDEDRETLEKFCAMKDSGADASAIDWKSMLRLVLTILQQFITIVLIAFLCLAASSASAQIAQAPPVDDLGYVSIQGRSSTLSQPHPCTCGCEETGKCLCPNCNVGCGFSTAKKKQPGIIEIPFGPDGKPPRKSAQQSYGLNAGGGWTHQGNGWCSHPTGWQYHYQNGQYRYAGAATYQPQFSYGGGFQSCGGGR